MKISCVTVSVDYSDYLQKCTSNSRHLSEWLIVTTSTDKKTIQVCNEHNLQYITTDLMYTDNSPFAKGKCVDYGISVLQPTDWILQLDSDIKLPSNFSKYINSQPLEKNCIYGSSRQFNNKKRIEIDPHTNTEHRRPLIGFFQLWHSSKYNTYPTNSNNAGGDDQEHSLRFNYPDEWKYLDILVEDVSGICCENWYGRKLHKRIKCLK